MCSVTITILFAMLSKDASLITPTQTLAHTDKWKHIDIKTPVNTYTQFCKLHTVFYLSWLDTSIVLISQLYADVKFQHFALPSLDFDQYCEIVVFRQWNFNERFCNEA